MANGPNRANKRLRIRRSRNQLTRSYVDACKALQDRILKRRNGEPVPSSVDDIRAARDGVSYVSECRALQDKIRQEHGGELMPDSTDIIREMREGDLK